MRMQHILLQCEDSLPCYSAITDDQEQLQGVAMLNPKYSVSQLLQSMSRTCNVFVNSNRCHAQLAEILLCRQLSRLGLENPQADPYLACIQELGTYSKPLGQHAQQQEQ